MQTDAIETIEFDARLMRHDPPVAGAHTRDGSRTRTSPVARWFTVSNLCFLIVPLTYAALHVGLITAYAHNAFGHGVFGLLVILGALSSLGAVGFGLLAIANAITYSKSRHVGAATLAIATLHLLIYTGLVIFNLVYCQIAAVTL